MNKIRGQINIGLVAALGALVVASVSLAWNAVVKSGEAIDRISATEGDIKEIKNDIRWIRESLDPKTILPKK